MIPPSTTITPEGRRLRRVLIVSALVLVGGNLLAFIFGQVFPSQRVGGPSGSSYVTTAYGAAAWAELLVDEGQSITRLRGPYTPDRLPTGEALVLVEAGLATLAGPELGALREFLQQGGHLVIAGLDPGDLVNTISTDPPQWTTTGTSAASIADPLLSGVDYVPLGGTGSFATLGEASELLADGAGRAVAVHWSLGAGTVYWLADATPLLNGGLADGDSAGLAVALTVGRPVIFDEFRHGYGGDSLWQSLPHRWANTIALLGAAALLALIAYARRLGPPEEVERKLPPDRARYVDSVAAILGRTGMIAEAVEPVRHRARRLLARRAGLGHDSDAEQLRSAGREAGLDPDLIEALLDPDGDPIVTGRALATLSKSR
ncbi:MAG TPA: DUF4350 domain-containing protein [Acidimicrobiia bacterium]|nr:DUF4350 domain-containing protein [Acidimicrobiia bacterium]